MLYSFDHDSSYIPAIPMHLQVVGDLQGEEAIIGRDILNQFIVTLNGLASVVEISD